MVNYNTSSPALPALGRQIFGYLPASSFKKPHWLEILFVAHLAHFLVCLVGRPRFCFVRSWIVDLAMGKAESKGADVAVGFSKWPLWKVLTIF